MGNDSSQIEKFTDAVLANFDNFVIVEGQEVQGIFGKCVLYQKKSKQNEYVICKKIQIGSEAKQKHIQQYFEQRMQIQHSNLLKFYGYSFNRQNSICSTNYSFNAYFEYHPISLLQENNNRQQNEEIYQLNELWYMAKCLISLCDYLQQNDEVHPNIHPSSIFLTEAGQLKLVDSSVLNLSSPQQKQHHMSFENSQTHAQMQFEQRYIAPEEVIHQKNMNKYKLSVFQIGMTLLESALIQDCSYIYLEDDSINQNSLDFLINKVQEVYGDQFTTFLKKMLQLNPNNRPDIHEIYQQQFKSVDQTNQSQLSLNRMSEVVGETSPIPRSMRLNSSLINQGNFLNNQPSQQNSVVNSNNTNVVNNSNNNNHSRISSSRYVISKTSTLQQIGINNQPNSINQSIASLQSKSNIPQFDNNLIKSPINYYIKMEKATPIQSVQTTQKNSPIKEQINTSFNFQEANNNSQKALNQSVINANNNPSSGHYLHNFQSFSNTMNNPQVENNGNSGLNNSNTSIGQSWLKQNNTNYYSFNQTQHSFNQNEQQHGQPIKYIESNNKNSQYSNSPPKMLVNAQELNQNAAQQQIKNNESKQQQQFYQKQPSQLYDKGDSKLNQSTVSTQGLKDSYLIQNGQQHQTNNEVREGSVSQQFVYQNPVNNTTTVYKVHYSRGSSPQNITKQSPNQFSDKVSFGEHAKVNDLKNSKVQGVQNSQSQQSSSISQQNNIQEINKKINNYYSQTSNSHSQLQNQQAETQKSMLAEQQLKRKSITLEKDESLLDKNGVESQNQKKSTQIKTTQIVHPKQIALNITPK
ncbi:protein kinase (macronuclear) [Tetrahymena thermophila SB210]|uniref:Protein kinase n=1 Tax=Tetrahymena thermophila (strain SB210) TaxID=312017 RepID=I7MJJ7_TETTS|nr:protein kinase [Tetrahymena thermophila SB210]EAS06322.2 protein kinase [Tetrahymena thermophila SB210]|eukprot:XP_001026567.2 protein kinase [Tetrahymena thermophila SB210]